MGERRSDYNRHRRREEMPPRRRVEQPPNPRHTRPYPEERRERVRPEYPYAAQKKQGGRRTQRRRQQERRRRRRGFLLVVVLILILIGAYAAAKIYTAMDRWQGKSEKSDFQVVAANPTEIEEEIINVAVFGTDEDGFRADVNMVASFNTSTKELHMISVPRDTRVVMTDEMIAHQEKTGGNIPNRNGVYGQCKLTELHAYAGEGNRNAFSVAMLEELLGLQIDYYVKVDLSAFRQIVDAVGGVDFEVEDRLYYSDPYQNLYIDLYPGMQHLDGDKAEQLVRFREGYAQKDLKRIQVQQKFIQALIEKVCSSDTLLKNMNDLVKVVLDCTESDITVSEALKYVKYIKDLDPAKITSDTVPGEGGSYFDMDAEGTKELIDWRIYGIEPPQTEQNTEEGQMTNG